jgi:Ca2+-transporting ATPase
MCAACQWCCHRTALDFDSQVVDAVRQCRDAGIRVVMITGDHAVTARAIAAKLALADAASIDAVHTGADIDALSADQLRATVQRCSVFARASPEHKLRLVRAFKANGEVVAMTGDGVNDRYIDALCIVYCVLRFD